jgi:uncharacterized membrane protein
MSVSLSDANRRPIVTFRRSGGQVFVDTVEDGETREHPVTQAELSQLASFIGDLATTHWSDAGPADADPAPAPAQPAAPAAEQPATRSAPLPPYPQSARWVPAPAGGQTTPPDGGRT